MQSEQRTTVLVNGRSHWFSYTVEGDWVHVTTELGTRTVASRMFEPEELARIIAVGMLSDRERPPSKLGDAGQ